MPRYIDADKALEFIKKTNANYHWLLSQYSASWVYDFIESQPFADVVPKSEFDLYKKQVDELEDELATTYDKLENAKAEVAMEIFEEIEKILDEKFSINHGVVLISKEDFAELKDKYTNGGEADA